MKITAVRAYATVLAAGIAAGCTGQIGELPSATGGSGSGAGNSTGSGSAGTGASGTAGNSGTAGSAGAVGAGGGAGADPTGTAGTTGTPPTQINLSGSPQYHRFVRLTNAQWARAVQDVLKLPAASGLEQMFLPAVAGTTDFANNELVLDVTQRAWSDFQMAAETLAAQVTATDAALRLAYSGTDAAGLISTLGRRAYRRPLTAAETSTYMTLYNQGAALTGTRSAFLKGASLVIRAMLQSPFFLFRTETGANGTALSGYEIAAKMSLWLLGTTPSDALLDQAASGQLNTADGAGMLATTMLGDQAARAVMRQFHGELLHFDRYLQISKIGVPTYREALNAEFQEISYLYFDKIFMQGLGLKQILTSTTGFVGAGTAPLYGVTAPASGYVERELGAQRVGYFAQLPYLTLQAHNNEPSSILRGVGINLDVLCAQLGPPAPVIPAIPPLVAGQTNRQRIDTLTATCGQSCHNDMINPLGFALEHFDGMGQWRDTENGGLTIDSSGSYTFVDGTKRNWTGAADLMQTLAETPQAHTCYAKKLASYALQRDIVVSDMPMLTALTSTSMASTGSVRQLVIDLVRNNAFRTRVGGTP